MTELKISHSSIRAWKTCKELYYLSRVEKWESKYKGASLSFGSAIDETISYVLKGLQDSNDVRQYAFRKFRSDQSKGWSLQFDNPHIRYRDKDFDTDLLTDLDKTLVKQWETELGITSDDVYKAFKQNKYIPMSEAQLKFFNRICWLTLENKGRLMIEHFNEVIYPKIKKVHCLQHKIEGKVDLPVYQNYPTEASITGYVDFILDMEGYDHPVVFDLKTAAMPYEEYSAKFSEQLLMYLAATGEALNTNLVGYIVLLKQMKTDFICGKCGAKKESSHRTCNQEIGGTRCKGEWLGTPKAESQIIVNELKKEHVEAFKASLVDQAELMRLNKRIKDLDSCFKYDQPCDMFSICWSGDTSNHYKK